MKEEKSAWGRGKLKTRPSGVWREHSPDWNIYQMRGGLRRPVLSYLRLLLSGWVHALALSRSWVCLSRHVCKPMANTSATPLALSMVHHALHNRCLEEISNNADAFRLLPWEPVPLGQSDQKLVVW